MSENVPHAADLEHWKRVLRGDQVRLLDWERLWSAYHDLLDDGMLLTSWRDVSRTKWGRAYDACHPDDRVIFDWMRVCALLATDVQSRSSANHDESVALLGWVETRDPLVERAALPALYAYLSPLLRAVDLRDSELARELNVEGGLAERLANAAELAEKQSIKRQRIYREKQGFERYVAAIRSGDPSARSLNFWVTSGPPEVHRLYGQRGSKTMTRSIEGRWAKLPAAMGLELERLQGEIFRRELNRENNRGRRSARK